MADTEGPLVPNANANQLEKLDKLADIGLRNLNLGTFKSILIEDSVKSAIQLSLIRLDEICYDCTGDHDTWTVAGGYPTFKMGHTTTYNDIDVFVCCNGKARLPTTHPEYPFDNVYEFMFGLVKVQIVQVYFDCNLKNIPGSSFYDMMCMYVLSRFDIPLCRVTMKFSLEVESDVYVLDMSALDDYRDTNKSRLVKYKLRRNPNDQKTVPSLKMMAANALLK